MANSLSSDTSVEDFYNQAAERFEQSDYQASIACCNQAIALDPNHINAWCLKGQAFQALEEEESALECFDRVIGLAPESYQVWELRSYSLHNLERREAALESIDQAIALMPKDSQDWRLYDYRGHWLCSLNRSSEAITSFEKAVEILSAISSPNPEDLSNIWSVLGNLYAEAEQYGQASAAYESAPFLRRDTEEFWLYVLMEVGRQDEILARYNDLVKAEPESDVAWKRRGLAMQKLGRFGEAIDSYKRAVTLNPTCTVWYDLQQTLKQLGRETEILDCYKEVLAIYPDQAELWAGQAHSLSQLGRKEEALASYQQAISLDLNNEDAAYAWHGYAISLQEFGRIEEAISAYRRAATIASTVVSTSGLAIDFWCDLGDILFEMERYEAALECYDSTPFLRYDSELNYVEALTTLDRVDNYIAQFDQELENCANSEQKWLKRGQILERLEELEAAIDSYKQALAINSKSQAVLDSLGNALFNLERDEEAIAVFDRLIQLDPNNSQSYYYNKARSYAYLEQFNAALENLEKAIELEEINHRKFATMEDDSGHNSKSMYREFATAEAAFEPLRENEKFRQIIDG